MKHLFILEINVNNQLRHAYSADTKEELFNMINSNKEYDNEYDNEYYVIYLCNLNDYNSIKILFENNSIKKIKTFLLK
jgi:hypothetical protein